MQIIRGKIPGAKKVVVYGPEGIGKSTFAAHFPEPLFIDTEGSTKDMDVARTESPTSWMMLMEQVRYVKNHPELCRTLVVDTADWAEMLCITQICDKNHKASIEEFGYGKGYVYVQEEFGRLLNALEEVVKAGIHVVLTAHAKMRKFEQPDELGAYDRWEMKLTKQTAPMVKEWADMVLFANYKTFVINVDGQGVQKGKNKAQGGKRVMYTSHHSCWDAKNRYGLPEELPFEYEAIRSVMENQDADGKRRETTAQNAAEQPVSEQEYFPEPKSSPKPETETKRTAPVDSKQEPVAENKQMELNLKAGASIEPDPRIKKSLRDLMIANDICEWDIQNVCEAKGYVPVGTPVRDYDEVNPGIVDGLLVASWDQVYAAIREMKEKDALVFN
ncbi:MAG TPA: ATP-binding protein [Candidatus Enterocloster faecavium]|uniref:ATP-binding protein n=1 Tax=Candidatus Enterocloster faecavium TaxID=2838560 RepID=A0A9D2L5Y3_9FIRM|nr:ATP-binding protein [Candidatus Enterocloster faecavium]